MLNEFSPPQWHPARTTTPEPRATVRTAPRRTLARNRFRAVAAVIRPAPAASAGHPRPGAAHPFPARRAREAAGPAVAVGTEDQKTAAVPAVVARPRGWAATSAHRRPCRRHAVVCGPATGSTAGRADTSAPWLRWPACRR